MSIPCLSLNIACRFLAPAALPAFKGSTLRGAFGHALKTVTCALRRQDCETCLLAKTCGYALIFATEKLCDSHVAARPHPYILNLPATEQQNYETDEPFEFNLVLLGPALRFLPHIIYAIEEMGKHGLGKGAKEGQGRFALTAVRMGHVPDAPPLYDERDKTLRQPGTLPHLALEETGQPVRELTIELLTPLRIKKDNRLLQATPDFADLVRAALRRVSMLEKHYGENPSEPDYHKLVRQAETVSLRDAAIRWQDYKRYSNRQRQDMSFGGLVGSLRFQGDLASFLPFLHYCEAVNLGKQTAFGLGKIRITAESS
ncbi:MAG: CRISPR system precrRNA processing endoribonuclease RAMP protein Cas6 [Deltaproteobacteria bacterium]|nr:CRISPR system precrRNA processing endoribonuclease RAMP protein Cas6 [Deltaproteobacteria bacterium]